MRDEIERLTKERDELLEERAASGRRVMQLEADVAEARALQRWDKLAGRLQAAEAALKAIANGKGDPQEIARQTLDAARARART